MKEQHSHVTEREDNNLQERGFYHVSPGEASGPPQVGVPIHIIYDNSEILVNS